MTRQLPIIIALGLGSAVLYAAALSGLAVGLIVTYLAQLPLFIVGLWLGGRAAAIAGATGIIALAVIGGAIPGLLFAVSTVLPVSLLVTLALRKRTWTDGNDYWYPPGNLLRTLALWCAALLIGAAMVFNLAGNGFEVWVAGLVSQIVQMVEQGAGQTAPAATVKGMVGVLPGVLAWSWMMMATVNGLLAQAIVKRIGRNLRPSPRMREIDIPLTWAGLFGAAVLLSYLLSGDIGFTVANLAIVLAYPLLFQGLSVIHAALASIGAWTISYVAFYAVMILFGWLALAVVALGLAEPVLKLRARLTRPKNT